MVTRWLRLLMPQLAMWDWHTEMPVHKITTTRDGKTIIGYRWGGHGKLYTGPDAKGRAAAQGRAAYANGYKGKTK